MFAQFISSSFKRRLIVLFVSLITAILFATLIVVNRQNIRNARANIEKDLQITVDVFRQILDDRTRSLFDIVRPATSDHAFKQAFSNGHVPTLLSAMNNLINRIYNIPTSTMLLVDFDNRVIASTLENYKAGNTNPWPELVRLAQGNDYLEASAIVVVNDIPHQMIVTPMLIPDPEAWIMIGFPVDDDFAQTTRRITRKDVSIITNKSGDTRLVSSSLEEPVQKELGTIVEAGYFDRTGTDLMVLNGERFLTTVAELASADNNRIFIAIQGSLEQELEPYRQLNNALYVIFLLSVIISIIATILIAKSITRPIARLSGSARLIGEGDYSQRVQIQQKDEIGELGNAFNLMAQGLEEKEKVRNLLGKVVSNEIAEELMSREIELGGEEKEVTVLFSDLRGFTSLCEGMNPHEILGFLNEYFTVISVEIERNHGVVDKYIGDAVMALFGAPLSTANDAENAVRTSLGMVRSLEKFNRDLVSKGRKPVETGIGINTDNVVVGNMGSENRLNFTVIGDGVNLASRLEGLTKFYGVPIIASESTMIRCRNYSFRELDTVRVKGKVQPAKLYQPLGPLETVSLALKQELEEFENALCKYKSRDWAGASGLFRRLVERFPDTRLYRVYDERCTGFMKKEPGSEWDGSISFMDKS